MSDDLTHDPDQLVSDLDNGTLRFAHSSATGQQIATLLGMPGLATATWVDNGGAGGGRVHVTTAVPVAHGEHVPETFAVAHGGYIDEGHFADAGALLGTLIRSLRVTVAPTDDPAWWVIVGTDVCIPLHEAQALIRRGAVQGTALTPDRVYEMVDEVARDAYPGDAVDQADGWSPVVGDRVEYVRPMEVIGLVDPIPKGATGRVVPHSDPGGHAPDGVTVAIDDGNLRVVTTPAFLRLL